MSGQSIVQVQRIAAGIYEVSTPYGTFEVLRHGLDWFTTFPAARTPDSVHSTLSAAVADITDWTVEQRELAQS